MQNDNSYRFDLKLINEVKEYYRNGCTIKNKKTFNY